MVSSEIKIVIFIVLLFIGVVIGNIFYSEVICSENNDDLIINEINKTNYKTLDSFDFRPHNNAVYRYHDDELNVTCWIYNGYTEAGISCIPDDQIPSYFHNK